LLRRNFSPGSPFKDIKLIDWKYSKIKKLLDKN
jgi:hypothetical protein